MCRLQVFLNYLTNYVPEMWSEEKGCTGCDETHIPLPEDKEAWPIVLVAIVIPGPSPFLLEVLEHVSGLDYPQSRMALFLHNQVSTLLILIVSVCDCVCVCTCVGPASRSSGVCLV